MRGDVREIRNSGKYGINRSWQAAYEHQMTCKRQISHRISQIKAENKGDCKNRKYAVEIDAKRVNYK